MIDIAYSLDAAIPGFYAWFGSIAIRVGGSKAEPRYPGRIHARSGVAIVLPGYIVLSTYQGGFDG